MKSGSRVILALMVVAVLALVAVPLLFELPDTAFIWIEIQNTGHTPLFGVVALLLLGLSVRLLGRRFKKRQTHYVIALIGTCFLGAFTEYAQIDGPRDADLSDFIRDVAGAVAFLGLYMYFDVQLRQSWRRMTGTFRKVVLLVAALVLMLSLVPLSMSSIAYLYRNNSFPVICDFDSYRGKRFWTTQSARLRIVTAPSAMGSANGSVGQLTLRAGKYPHFGIMEPCPDWGDYHTLSVDIYSPLDSTVNIHVRVEDSHHNGDFSDRFNRTFAIVPGENHVAISLSEIRSAPEGREMDMSAITALYVFAVDLQQQLTLYIDNLRLQ